MAYGDSIVNPTISSTAQTMTDVGFSDATVIANAVALLVTTDDDALRWLDDGTAPTATKGHLLAAGNTYRFNASDGINIPGLQFIRETTDVVATMQLISAG